MKILVILLYVGKVNSMSFFFALENKKKINHKKISTDEFCYEYGCKVCVLNKESNRKSKIEPTGTNQPLVYIVTDVPCGTNEKYAEKVLENIFGCEFVAECIRWNSILRCVPENNNSLNEQEILCCKKSVEKDIEKTKPLIIISIEYFRENLNSYLWEKCVGQKKAVLLNWHTQRNKILLWRGRKLLLNIGNQPVWYYPVLLPKLIIKNNEKLIPELESVFKYDLKRIEKDIKDKNFEQATVEKNYKKNIHLISGKEEYDLDKLKNVLNKLKNEPEIGLDIETNCKKPWVLSDSKILTIAVGTYSNTWVFPVDHPDGWDKKHRKNVKELLKDFLLNSGLKICHNLKFELIWLNWFFGQDIIRQTDWADTMSQAYVIDERSGDGALSLDGLCLINFGFSLNDQSNLDVTKLIDYPVEDVLNYNGLDTKYTYKLFQKQKSLIKGKLVNIYNQHIETSKTLALMEIRGLNVDLVTVKKISKNLHNKLIEIEKDLYKSSQVKKYEKLYGKFKHTSTKHLVIMFRDVLKIKRIKGTTKNKETGYSFDMESLVKFAEKGILLAEKILKYRKTAKLLSTYIDSVEEKYLYDDKKIHADFNAMFTSTGRIMSSGPNVQNYPKRINKYVRGIIDTPDNHYFVSVDYSQIEARGLAAASDELIILDVDIHMKWALRVAQLYPQSAGVNHYKELDEKALKIFRAEIKTSVVFPLFYGATVGLLERTLNLSKKDATDLYDVFWDTYKKVKKWQEKTIIFYNQYGYVEALSGRRRYGPLVRNKILNTPIQGASADVMIRAMNRLSLYSYKLKKYQYQPVLNIHDDLSFYVPEKTLEDDIKFITKEMVKPVKFLNGVPLEVEVSIGKNWADLTEIGKFSEKDYY